MFKSGSRWGVGAGLLMIGAIGGFFVNEWLPLQAQPEVRVAPAAPAIPKELTSYRDIVKMVAPAVTAIEARSRTKRPPARPNTTFFDGFADDLLPAQAQNPEIAISFGSGFVVDAKGVILTNFHVVDGAESLEIRLPDGRKFPSKEWHGDRKTDLAIIRIHPDKPLPTLQFGDSDQMEVGDRVLAVGCPFGLAGSVTHGIISAKSRNLRINQYEDFLQTDAAINPGNSGGPLINLEGKVIGINSAIKSKSGGFQGVGMAISSNLAKQIVQQLLTSGSVKRAYLGVKVSDIDADRAAKLGLKDGGVMVTKIFDRSPAAKGGLRLSDILHSLNGKPVRNSLELQKIIAGLPVNEQVDIAVTRDGKAAQVRFTVEEQPEEFGETPK